MTAAPAHLPADARWMRRALALARRGLGRTSPNPAVGAVIVRSGHVLGEGWHHRAGLPHAEIEALRTAAARGHDVTGATLYVTLEPCCTHGRTPPCTQAILQAGIRRVVAAATDPNPRHAGRGFTWLRRRGLAVVSGVLDAEAARLNDGFNHWIVHQTPLVTVKAAMTLDGKIATANGESRWITGPPAREFAQRLRRRVDAILVGIKTVLADNPSLTRRGPGPRGATGGASPGLRRIILDSRARTPLDAKVASDPAAAQTTVVVTRKAPARRVAALRQRVRVVVAPARAGRVDLRWLLRWLGREQVTHLLVEGGGEVNAAFLHAGLAQRVLFFYAPRILGGRRSRVAVAGPGARSWAEILPLADLEWRRLGADLCLQARVAPRPPRAGDAR